MSGMCTNNQAFVRPQVIISKSWLNLFAEAFSPIQFDWCVRRLELCRIGHHAKKSDAIMQKSDAHTVQIWHRPAPPVSLHHFPFHSLVFPLQFWPSGLFLAWSSLLSSVSLNVNLQPVHLAVCNPGPGKKIKCETVFLFQHHLNPQVHEAWNIWAWWCMTFIITTWRWWQWYLDVHG